jgi:alpha-ketoglutarate-dependent taurine dioxygenase
VTARNPTWSRSATRHIGAELRGLDLRQPDDETIRAIYRAWLDHLVIVFRADPVAGDLVRVTGWLARTRQAGGPPEYFPKGYSTPAASC